MWAQANHVHYAHFQRRRVSKHYGGDQFEKCLTEALTLPARTRHEKLKSDEGLGDVAVLDVALVSDKLRAKSLGGCAS